MNGPRDVPDAGDLRVAEVRLLDDFVLTGLATSLVNLMLHGAVYFLFLKDFYAAHPARPEDLSRQLNGGGKQLVAWSLILSALAFGFFITLVVRWSGAKTLASGFGAGLAFGVLCWAGVDFGLFASANNFSLASTLVDIVCSGLCMAMSAGFAAWMLGPVRISRPRERRDRDDLNAWIAST